MMRVSLSRPAEFRVRPLVAFSAAALLLTTAALGGAENSADPDSVNIGVVDTLFRDVPKDALNAAFGSFKELAAAEMGLKSDVEVVQGPFDIGDRLASGRFQFGVFNGFEFAWLRKRHPDLTPLALIVNQQQRPHACLVVRGDSPAKDFAALRGKSLAFPNRTAEFGRLFLERACEKNGSDVKRFFGAMIRTQSLEDALDDVVDGKAAAAVVDGVGLASYEHRKPARFARLKVLERSIDFPAAVIAYRKGTFEDGTLDRMRGALVAYGQKPEGEQLLTLCRLSGFEDVPQDYDRLLAASAKAYPPPKTARTAQGR